MRIISLSLVSILVATVDVLGAQPTVNLRDGATAVARSDRTHDTRNMPAGVITSMQFLFAGTTGNVGIVSTFVIVAPLTDGVELRGSTTVSSLGSLSAPASGAASIRNLLVTWPGDQVGRLVIDLNCSQTSGVTLNGLLSVDVGDDGLIDVSSGPGTWTRTLPVCSTGSLRVRLDLTFDVGGLGSNNAGGGCGVNVRFLPGVGPAHFEEYGDPCGPTLRGSDPTVGLVHNITWDVSNGPTTGGMAVFALGAGRSAIPISGTPCLLRAFPIVTFVVPTDARGSARLQLPLHGPHPLFIFHSQALLLDSVGWFGGTNGIEVTVRDCW